MTTPDRISHARTAGDLVAALRATLDAWTGDRPPPRLTVAFSGGLDSTVLLAALCRLGSPVSIRAAHVDHGIHAHSAQWNAHCARVAAELGVELAAIRVDVDRASGLGLEAAARDARYAALRELLTPGEWLLTAHHGDDQLETVLLRLLRGTGVRGLRGIIPFAPFGAGSLGRPLLNFTRAELHAQAAAWNLKWIDDPSNLDPRHDRNYLRLTVLPALLERWPEAAERAERLAEQMSDAERLLDAVAADDARLLAAPWHVPRAVLAALEPARQRNLLRFVLREVHLSTPGSRKLEELRCALHAAHPKSHAIVSWHGGEGRVFRAALFLGAPLPQGSPPDYAARIEGTAGWSGPEGRVEWAPAEHGGGLPESWLDDGLTLRFRSGGERFQPRGRQHRHSLKDLFQEEGIVPWMRDRVPLFYRGDSLVAIGDLSVSADADGVPAHEPRWCVRWTEHPPLRAPQRP